MSRSKKVNVIGTVAILVAAAAAIAVIVFGFIGVGQTVTAGTQPRVCGMQLGVTTSGQTVRLLGVSADTLSPGDRVRASALCVIEIVSIEDSKAPGDEDGAGAQVQLRWRLW